MPKQAERLAHAISQNSLNIAASIRLASHQVVHASALFHSAPHSNSTMQPAVHGASTTPVVDPSEPLSLPDSELDPSEPVDVVSPGPVLPVVASPVEVPIVEVPPLLDDDSAEVIGVLLSSPSLDVVIVVVDAPSVPPVSVAGVDEPQPRPTITTTTQENSKRMSVLYPARVMARLSLGIVGRIAVGLRWLPASLAGVACGGGGGGDPGTAATSSPMTSDAEASAGSTSATGTGTGTDPTSPTTAVDGSTTAVEGGWEVVYEAGEDEGAIFSVWGPDAARVYAVGGQQGEGGLSVGTMLVRDAGAWSTLALPTDTPKLNWIHGGPTIRVAVGERGAILRRTGDDDATAWTVEGCATVLPLWGAWAVADDDVWAVGGDGFDRPPVLCHFDGAAWENVELPVLEGDPKALFKVFGLAADDVWAVGDVGLVLHYDGAAWTRVPIDTTSDIISLWGTGPTELLAVGGRASGVLARWDGAAWSVTDLAENAGLNGVWMDPAGEAHTVGIGGTVLAVAPGSTSPMAEEVPTLLTLHAVWSPGDGTFVAVGGSLEMPPPLVGIIVEKN